MPALGDATGPRPSKLGRYELITRIGQGGMAEVQLALQRGPAGFEKLVVVKLVHENLASQKAFVDMLLDEAKLAALVKHPNVVDIYDLGQVDGRYFIAMEYLEGEPLLAVLRAGREGKRLDPLSTARLIADTAEGLDAAHELRTMAGEPIELVHHDISLGNIVVLYNGQVKLVDFGVAKATQSAGPRAKIQGKFSYMAPEKLRGASGDRRSDIWSLGCVLWEALTLRRLFKGGNDADTMRQVLETKIAIPSSVNGDVSKDFDRIVMKALDREPAKRYATAKEMASDLEEVLRQHKYGGKNDLIAKYMQATFEPHIVARKKLLQEVSSKGGASEDVIEAAFTEVASGSPAPVGGEFSVRFRRPTGEAVNAFRMRSDSFAPPMPPRMAKPSGSFLSEPYEPDAATALDTAVDAPALPSPPNKKLIAGIAGGIVLGIIIIAVAFGGGGKQPAGAPSFGLASGVATDGSGSSAAANGNDAAITAGSATPASPPTPTEPAPPPGDAPELFKSGMQAYVTGDAKTAIGQFRKALQANPEYTDAWRALGLAHEKLGEWGQAKTALERYLQLAPEASDAAAIRDRISNL